MSLRDSFLDEEDQSSKPSAKKCGGIRAWKWCLTVLSVFLPPVAVFLGTKEVGFHLVLNIVLFVLGWIGAVVHAVSIIWCTSWVDRAYESAPYATHDGQNPLL